MTRKCFVGKNVCWQLKENCLVHPKGYELPKPKKIRGPIVVAEEPRVIQGKIHLVKVCSPFYDKNLCFDFAPKIKVGGIGQKQWNREKQSRWRRGGCDLEGCLCGREYSSVKVRYGYQTARRLMELVGRELRGGVSLDSNWMALLGCSTENLKSYIAKQFEPEMSWNNWGDWHLDHIRPLSSFNLDDNQELEKACHYSNLQPLWAFDNLSKGGRWTG